MEIIDRETLQDLLDSGSETRVVMVLGPQRYRQAHIPGSETFGSIEEALDDLQPDEDIVVYCSGTECFASSLAHRILTGRGYERVRRYPGGLADWAAAGLPLARGTDGAGAVEVAA
jgi:rhodanese-related sulfurtransferase